MNPRVVRGKGPKGKLSEHNYRRRAFEPLFRDFSGRCAYSMRSAIVSGNRCLEVDHFNPTLKNSRRHAYSNLMLATRLCNNFKQDTWPTKEELRNDLRFLDPTKEMDYGIHIVEDPTTHELIGLTPPGRYHIDNLDLNNESLTYERRQRAKLLKLRDMPSIKKFEGDFQEIKEAISIALSEISSLIPEIPYAQAVENPPTNH